MSVLTSSAPDIESVTGELPRHIAIIMDGNNRWAKRRGLPGTEGHKAGEAAVYHVVEHAARLGVEVLTVFAFSSENWRRPEQEVSTLMALFLKALARRVDELHENGIRLRFIGDLTQFSEELQSGMASAEQQTQHNTRMTMVVAVNYGGQWDMANAARRLSEKVARGELAPENITTSLMAEQLQMADLPPVDLLIRTGGDMRLSNFLLWQAAYAELYFTDVLWPDFDPRVLDAALSEYAGRQRRFGRTSEQVEASRLV